jgi:hypothetical protein
MRTRLALLLHRLADEILPPEQRPPVPVEGKLLQFIPTGQSLGRPVYTVVSRRGEFKMGVVDWSNQWRRARFTAHSESVFDKECIAEIYACMREMK